MRRILFISSLLCVLTACDDYLDRQPESSVTPEVYMNDAEHLVLMCLKHIVLSLKDIMVVVLRHY